MDLMLPTDKLILETLTDGRNMPVNIAAEIDRERQTINNRITVLRDYGLVRTVGVEGAGLYELTDRGRAVLAVIDRYRDVDDFEALIEAELDSNTTQA